MTQFNKSSLDTCILVRIITEIPAGQARKASALIADKSSSFVVDDVAIVEAVHVLETIYFYNREEIVGALQALLSATNIECSNALFGALFPLYLSHPKLSFNDIYLSLKSEAAAAEPLWTFDKKLAAQLPSPKLLG